MEEELKTLKAELKIAYKEQVVAKKKADKELSERNQKKILAAIKKSGKSTDEILSMLGIEDSAKNENSTIENSEKTDTVTE